MDLALAETTKVIQKHIIMVSPIPIPIPHSAGAVQISSSPMLLLSPAQAPNTLHQVRFPPFFFTPIFFSFLFYLTHLSCHFPYKLFFFFYFFNKILLFLVFCNNVEYSQNIAQKIILLINLTNYRRYGAWFNFKQMLI